MEKKHILVIDDESDLVDIMESILEGAGYLVTSAKDGADGLKRLEHEAPDLIVLDMNMPRMGGIEFYHEIFDKDRERPRYPVLIVTARANLEQLFQDLNVDGFLTKPFEVDTLLQKVDLILKAHEGSGNDYVIENTPATPEADERSRVLLIEDGQAVIDKLKPVFSEGGFRIISARSGLEGIDRARAQKPEGILVNLNLPDLGGDMVVFKLKQIAETCQIPVVIYTKEEHQLNSESMRHMCEKMGVQDILGSHDPLVLLKKCQELFKGSRKPS